jgi:hypothetical protein
MDIKKLWHKRHPDSGWYDRVEVDIVPRYKTSGLSGDEWRTSVRVRWYFKGLQVGEDFFGRDITAAISYLPHVLALASDHGASSEWLKHQEKKCDQPGCSADAIGRFKLKRETSAQGDYIERSESGFEHYRQFCRQHLRRGDCGREDADTNYEPLDGVGPRSTSNVIESPSVFGGMLELDPES